jgi:hypothetical protein
MNPGDTEYEQVRFETRVLLLLFQKTACFQADLLLVLFFDPDDGGDMFLRNVGRLLTYYTALYPRREYCS